MGDIANFPEAINSNEPMMTAINLFEVKVDEKRRVLDEDWFIAFHHAVAQLLFVTTRCRRDIQASVSLLCIRIIEPDEILLKYIKVNMYLVFTNNTTGSQSVFGEVVGE